MVIVCDGDSLTAGYGASDTAHAYPGVLQSTYFPTATVYNKGVSGQTTAQMNLDATTDIDPLFAPGAWVIASEFVNEIVANVSADDAYAHMVTYCSGRKAAGFLVGVCTCTRFGNIAGSTLPPPQLPEFNAREDAVNANLRANFHDYADVLIDLAADPRFQNTLDTTYFQGDQGHFTDAGYAAFAELVAAGINGASSSVHRERLTRGVNRGVGVGG